MTYITKVMHTHDSMSGKEESKRIKGRYSRRNEQKIDSPKGKMITTRNVMDQLKQICPSLDSHSEFRFQIPFFNSRPIGALFH